MKTMMFSVAVGFLFAVSTAATCHASQLSDEYCHEFAEGFYAQAVADGDPLPDGVYEQAQADCELQEFALDQYRLWQPGVSLDAMMRADIARRVAEADAHMNDSEAEIAAMGTR